MFNKIPKRTGIYHIKDNIEHLELELHFRHINSLLKLPKFDYNKTVNNNNQQIKEKQSQIVNKDDIRIVRLKWQEKLFSATEKELYKNSKNCLTEKQKKYHEFLLKQAEEEERNLALEAEGPSDRRRRKKKAKRAKKQIVENAMPKHTNEIHTYIDEDNFQPTEKFETRQKNSKDILSTEMVQMYIYASIDVDTQLAHLQWCPKECLLYIYPDFNSFVHNPYFIEIDKDYRHLYAYALENISQTRRINLQNDLSLYLQLPILKPHWHTEEERAAMFSMPPKRTKRVSLLLELREACGFEYDGIHVRYHIKLPPNTIHEEGLLAASTHSSSSSTISDHIHHFGYNWQLTLLCEEDYDASDFLHIYFEIISIDSWERERVEGYAYFSTNLQKASARELHTLHCVRPVDTMWTLLERFFIGGRRKFDFMKFFGQERTKENKENESEFHSRYGCRMLSTGTLRISCQRFTQRNCELLESPCTNHPKNGMTLDDIMLAYQEARKRLEAHLTLE